MSEACEYPHFVIDAKAPVASREIALSVEAAITDEPLAMSEGLIAVRALQSWVNGGKDLSTIAREQEFKTDLPELRQSEALWRNFESHEAYMYIDFNPETEHAIKNDDEINGLIQKLHDSRNRNRNQEDIRMEIQKLRFGKYIQRVMIAKSQTSDACT